MLQVVRSIALLFCQVCDQPHPLLISSVIRHTLDGHIDEAFRGLKQLSDLGYSASDIITTLFRVVKNYDMAEYLKLEFIRVHSPNLTVKLYISIQFVFEVNM